MSNLLISFFALITISAFAGDEVKCESGDKIQKIIPKTVNSNLSDIKTVLKATSSPDEGEFLNIESCHINIKGLQEGNILNIKGAEGEFQYSKKVLRNGNIVEFKSFSSPIFETENEKYIIRFVQQDHIQSIFYPGAPRIRSIQARLIRYVEAIDNTRVTKSRFFGLYKETSRYLSPARWEDTYEAIELTNYDLEEGRNTISKKGWAGKHYNSTKEKSLEVQLTCI